MQFHRDSSEGINLVTGYGKDGLVVGEQLLVPPCVITLTGLIADWRPGAAASLTAQDLEPVIALAPEVILLGCGDTLVFPSPQVGAGVNRHGIGFEVMTTAAACRTYNVLAHEGRRVALALLAG